MAYQNQNFPTQQITDTGIVYLDPDHELESIFEGSIIFTATGSNVSGSFDVTAQLEGSNSADFSTGLVPLGSPVPLSDGVTSAIPLSGTQLAYSFYRVKLTGAGTQVTDVIGTYTMKGRD